MTSTLNTLKSNSGSRKKKLRKGRGIAAGQGASCGFGMRGQKSRSGRPTRPGFEGGQMPLYRRVPKLKHFEIINQKNFSIINLEKLNDFKDNDTVNIDSLVKKGLIFKPKFPLKILGSGKINVKLKVQAHAFTKVAKHYFCSVCGIYTHHNPRSNPSMTGFNLGCIDDIDTLGINVLIKSTFSRNLFWL